MSADWNLAVAAEWSPDEARSRVQHLLGGEVRDDAVFRGDMYVTVLGMIRSRAEFLEESFGFLPTLSITYHRKLLEGQDPAQYDLDLRDMAFSAHALADAADGDSVLLFNGEDLIFQRLHGVLTINADWAQWQRLGIPNSLTTAHEVRPLTSPLL